MNEDLFETIRAYMESSNEWKKQFLLKKIEHDSYRVQSTYFALQDTIKNLKAEKSVQNHHSESNIKFLNNLFKSISKRWDGLIAERRRNECVFSIWQELHQKCDNHSENMFFFWKDKMVCVGCEYLKAQPLMDN